MIDIVAKGHKPEYRYLWKCRHCGCEFTCDKSDMNSKLTGQARRYLDLDMTVFDKLFLIQCPTCGELLKKTDEEIEECRYEVPN